MFSLGIDIGYSNLKIAYGSPAKGTPTVAVFPSGAAPLDTAGPKLDGEHRPAVLVDGRPWIAGATQAGLVRSSQRSLDEDFPATDHYRALFNFALLRTGQEKIDHLVTGLPTIHFMEKACVTALTERLTGAHEVAPGVTINVAKVTLTAQPVGTLLRATRNEELNNALENGLVTVIDPGFYSMDWVAADRKNLVRDMSGTNMRAVSVILGRLIDSIKTQHGCGVTLEEIEDAVRRGLSCLPRFKRGDIDFRQLLEAAAASEGAESLREIRNQFRIQNRSPSVVLLTGGSANLYKKVATETFSQSQVAIAPSALTANAEGFWQCAI